MNKKTEIEKLDTAGQTLPTATADNNLTATSSRICIDTL